MDSYQVEDLIPERLRPSHQQVDQPLLAQDEAQPDVTLAPQQQQSERPGRKHENRRVKAKKVSDAMLLLSDILQAISVTELALILEDYEAAVRDEIIIASPLEGVRFTRSYRWQGQRHKRRIQDEAVLNTHRLQQWLEEKRKETRLENLRYEGRIETTLEKLSSGADDLQLLARLRRERLKASSSVSGEQ